jgi:hypothetical protein
MRKESKLPHDWFDKGRKDLRRVEILLADDDIEGAGFHQPGFWPKNVAFSHRRESPKRKLSIQASKKPGFFKSVR